MEEKHIFLNSGELELEGLLELNSGDKGVVITHPHPLYGGNMYNSVVEAVYQAYRIYSYSTLRFNFRGVGRSKGSYDNGDGEQDDIISSLDYLKTSGKKDIDLVGYSFGAWVNARVLNRVDYINRVIMISPPVDFLDFSPIEYNPKVRLVISGINDEFGDIDKIKTLVRTWNPKADLKIVMAAGHFYNGKTDTIKAIIHEFLKCGFY